MEIYYQTIKGWVRTYQGAESFGSQLKHINPILYAFLGLLVLHLPGSSGLFDLLNLHLPPFVSFVPLLKIEVIGFRLDIRGKCTMLHLPESLLLLDFDQLLGLLLHPKFIAFHHSHIEIHLWWVDMRSKCTLRADRRLRCVMVTAARYAFLV